MIKVFYLLKFACILSTLLLVLANQNPIYSVLNLVTLFVAGSILLLLLGLDFLPYVFIIVYAGAVAVLFLFVVIILKIKLGSTKTNSKTVIFIFILAFFFNALTYSLFLPPRIDLWCENYYMYDGQSNLSSLGKILYTEYNLHFVIGGLILLVAIIGAIVLTSRRRSISLKQKVFKQEERLNIIGKTKPAGSKPAQTYKKKII
jgi:NADH-quinone oxidoreductase subunit J